MTTAVIGGGLAGLVRARALAARGEEVVLFEAAREPGGVVRTEKRDGYLLELGPNTVRTTPELWGLVESLGLAGESLLADPRTPRFVDYGGRLHRVPMSPGALFSTTLLSWRGKARLLAEPFVAGRAVPAESVASFFSRRLGSEIAERLVEPFVSGIWAGRGDRLSAADAFPSAARWERKAGSIFRGALADRRARPKPASSLPRGLLSFRDGLTALPRRLAEELGPRARLGSRVDVVVPSGDGWRVSAGGQETEADRVVLATPARDAARLVESIAFEAAAALREIPHAPLAVLHVSSSARAKAADRLDGFGHLVAPSADRRILGAIWSSSLFPGRTPEGRALFTVFLGGARDPAALDLSDEELVDAARRDLSAVGLPGSLEVVRVTRYPAAIPQYEVGHALRIETLARAEERHRGLFFLGSYRGGISVGDVVRSAFALPD